MAVDHNERAYLLDEAIEKLNDVADILRTLDDAYLNAYALPQFEGRDSGWLGGRFVIDMFRWAREEVENSCPDCGTEDTDGELCEECDAEYS